ncbi:hypothetical protein J2T18_005000 [Paenibacillus polymyxa]|nr:hypothetical protein [Paenibacillus polymyxa]
MDSVKFVIVFLPLCLLISLTRTYISCKVVKIVIYRNSVDQGSKVQYPLYREETHGLKGFSPRMNVSLPCEL